LDKKISFAVENIALIDEKNESQFATISIDAFASGDNKHNLVVSEETLRKTAPSIYNKPLVWVYDERFDDIGSHDPYEIPCGFVPSNQEIQFKKLDDGRTMINVVGKIWKRYSGKPYRKYIARVFGVAKYSSCGKVFYMFQREVPRPGKCTCIDRGAACEKIASTLKIPDWWHNHGHLDDGTPVWFDTIL
jgi:hypothetical protein